MYFKMHPPLNNRFSIIRTRFFSEIEMFSNSSRLWFTSGSAGEISAILLETLFSARNMTKVWIPVGQKLLWNFWSGTHSGPLWIFSKTKNFNIHTNPILEKGFGPFCAKNILWTKLGQNIRSDKHQQQMFDFLSHSSSLYFFSEIKKFLNSSISWLSSWSDNKVEELVILSENTLPVESMTKL